MIHLPADYSPKMSNLISLKIYKDIKQDVVCSEVCAESLKMKYHLSWFHNAYIYLLDVFRLRKNHFWSDLFLLLYHYVRTATYTPRNNKYKTKTNSCVCFLT